MDYRSTERYDAIKLRALQVFLAVADAGTYREAGELTGITETAMRKHVDQLEEVLGEKVLHKEGGRLAKTLAGKRLGLASKSVFEQFEAITRLSDRAVAVAFLPHHSPLIAAAIKLQPDIELELKALGDRHRSVGAFEGGVLQGLAAGALDLVIGPPPRDGKANLISAPLYTARFEAMVASTRRAKAIELSDLAELPLILPPHRTRSRELLDARLLAIGAEATVVVEAYETKTLVVLGAAGRGTVVLPSDLARGYKARNEFGGTASHGFKWIPVTHNGEPLSHPIFTTSRRNPSQRVRDLRALLTTVSATLGY